MTACHYASSEGLEARPFDRECRGGNQECVAECVGRLTLPDSDPLLSKLKVRGEPRELGGRTGVHETDGHRVWAG